MEKVQEVELTSSIDDLTGYTIYNNSARICDKNGLLLAHFEKDIMPILSHDEMVIVDKLAKLSRTRGASAGKLDESLEYYKSFKNGKAAPGRKIVQTKGKNYAILAGSVKPDKRCMEVNNPVYSSAVGLYGGGNTSNLAKTKGTRTCGASDEDLSILCPYIRSVDKAMEVLVPEEWERQFLKAQTHSNLFNTNITTITINKNFRTSVHTDKGNVIGFYSALTVQTKGHYSGGYLLFPEYKIGFNIQSRDILIFNPQIKHANSEMTASKEQDILNKELGLTNTLVNGRPYIHGDQHLFRRYSFVFYQRSGL
tara:strand:+ start:4885 stop:5814 length:930 start_codon:yes stop_codon:yes gene_type:complete